MLRVPCTSRNPNNAKEGQAAASCKISVLHFLRFLLKAPYLCRFSDVIAKVILFFSVVRIYCYALMTQLYPYITLDPFFFSSLG